MKPQVTTLPNGARIIHDPNPGLQTMGIVAGIHVGCRYEEKSLNGISHLLEHLLFKGSEKYRNAKALSKPLDEKGGYLNAYTGQELTTIQGRVAADYGEIAADVVMNLLGRALLRTADIEREKPVVCDEIRMYAADDHDRIEEFSARQLYGAHPLSRPICGSVKGVMAMTPAAIRKFYQTHYTPQSIAVTLSGRYPESVVRIVEEALLGMTPSPRPVYSTMAPPAPVAGSTVFKPSITPRAFIRLAFRGPGPRSHMDCAAYVMANALGGCSSARLFSTLREKHSLCYHVGAQHEADSDHTVSSVGMELEPKNLGKAIELLGQELRKIAHKGITEAELASVKSYLRGALAVHRDSALHSAERYTTALLLDDRVESHEELLARYDAVSTQDVRAVAETYVTNAQTTILAPVKYEQVARAATAKHLDNL
jgi:predicted Zn-dependent peptidase